MGTCVPHGEDLVAAVICIFSTILRQPIPV